MEQQMDCSLAGLQDGLGREGKGWVQVEGERA